MVQNFFFKDAYSFLHAIFALVFEKNMADVVFGEEVGVFFLHFEAVCYFLFVVLLIESQNRSIGPDPISGVFESDAFTIAISIFYLNCCLLFYYTCFTSAFAAFFLDFTLFFLLIYVDVLKLECFKSLRSSFSLFGAVYYSHFGNHCVLLFFLSATEVSWATLVYVDKLFYFLLFYEEKPAGAVVFAYVIDGWDFPFLAEGGLIDPTLHFMIVFEVFFVKVNTFQEAFFGDRVGGCEIFGDGLQVDWSIGEGGGVSKDVI